MRHLPVSADLFSAHRERLKELLPDRSVAVVNANDLLPVNADATLPMLPNSDLFYLSGVEQEESILVLAPNASHEAHREILFLKEPNEHLKIWEGHKLSREEASKISGIQSVRWLSEFPGFFRHLVCESDRIFLNLNEHARTDSEVETREDRFTRECRRKFPLHEYRRLAPLLHSLRLVKDSAELQLMARAKDITGAAFERVCKRIQPGLHEFEVEAEFAHEFIRNRASFAFPPIVASGPNACVLHYQTNAERCRDGDLLLLDFGARYANYAADVSRTVPVNGRFTRRQKAIYNAVLRVLRASVQAAVPGKLHRDWNREAQELMTEELLQLGLLRPRDLRQQTPANPACRRYFMHGLGHSLGLDVHDVGSLQQPFAPGWVLTVEPGIYIPEEGIGVRLENNVLITENGPLDLTREIPIEAAEIEALMAKNASRSPRKPSRSRQPTPPSRSAKTRKRRPSATR